MDLPKRLQKIRLRIGNDGGFWISQAQFIGKNETKTSNEFYNNWGNWEEFEMKHGECIMGFEMECYTDENGDWGYKAWKSLKFLIGP